MPDQPTTDKQGKDAQKDPGNIASKRQEAAHNLVAKYGDDIYSRDDFADMIDAELDNMMGDNDYAKGTGEVPTFVPQPSTDDDEDKDPQPNTTPYKGTTASSSGEAKASTDKKQANN